MTEKNETEVDVSLDSNLVNGTEWIEEDSPEYQKILMFNSATDPIMVTAPGERLDCYVDQAYIYKTNDSKYVVGLVPRVQFAVNFDKYPLLAGEYVINDIVATDTKTRPFRYKVDHRQRVNLDFLNHIIDMNRPDYLDPQTIFDNVHGFKDICQDWTDRKWLNEKVNQVIQQLPDGDSESIDDRVVDLVLANPSYKRALEEWRAENWISEKVASEYAKSGESIKTVNDELAFSVEIAANIARS